MSDITPTKAKNILKAFTTLSYKEFKRRMQKRRIAEEVWRPVVEQDESFLNKLVYDSRPISDAHYQDNVIPLSRSDLISEPLYDKNEEYYNTGSYRHGVPEEDTYWDKPMTSGEKEFNSRWGK